MSQILMDKVAETCCLLIPDYVQKESRIKPRIFGDTVVDGARVIAISANTSVPHGCDPELFPETYLDDEAFHQLISHVLMSAEPPIMPSSYVSTSFKRVSEHHRWRNCEQLGFNEHGDTLRAEHALKQFHWPAQMKCAIIRHMPKLIVTHIELDLRMKNCVTTIKTLSFIICHNCLNIAFHSWYCHTVSAIELSESG